MGVHAAVLTKTRAFTTADRVHPARPRRLLLRIQQKRCGRLCLYASQWKAEQEDPRGTVYRHALDTLSAEPNEAKGERKREREREGRGRGIKKMAPKKKVPLRNLLLL